MLPYVTDGHTASMEGLYYESSGTTPYHFRAAATLEGNPDIQLIEVQGGQTLTQVAASNNTDWRQLATDNGITDPLEELVGETLTFRF